MLLARFAEAGARVLDATGTDADDKRRVLDWVGTEKHGEFKRSSVDVVVGIQRVVEGTDWPLCSTVYCYGMPLSHTLQVQIIGRAMRLKRRGYPASHKNKATVRFFVPTAGGEALEKLPIEHSRSTLLLCCFLADAQLAQEIRLTQVFRSLGMKPHPRANAKDKAEAIAAMLLAEAGLKEEEEPVTVEALRERMVAENPEMDRGLIDSVIVELLATNKLSAEQFRAISVKVTGGYSEVFDTVLKEFREDTIDSSLLGESAKTQAHNIAGKDFSYFSGRLRCRSFTPLSVALILDWMKNHYAVDGEYPTQRSGEVRGFPGENWGAIEKCLQTGLRDVGPGNSLAKLAASELSCSNRTNAVQLTETLILEAIAEHHQRTGSFPNIASGNVMLCEGENWRTWDGCLRNALRGITSKSSLKTLVGKYRETSLGEKPFCLSVDLVIEKMKEHKREYGKYPASNSGPVIGMPGHLWNTWEAKIRRGDGGFSVGDSLGSLKANFLPDEDDSKRFKSYLSVEETLRAADLFNEKYGRYPSKRDTEVPGHPGYTWNLLNSRLASGLVDSLVRGGLASLLEKHRGRRNKAAAFTWTDEMLKAAVKSHIDRSGAKPTAKSGDIDGYPGETWFNLNHSMLMGCRGFQPGNSLARFIHEHFGIQSKQNDISLDEVRRSVLQYRDKYGRWPTQRSGEVELIPGKTWSGIDQGLRLGRCGLPKLGSIFVLVKTMKSEEEAKATSLSLKETA